MISALWVIIMVTFFVGLVLGSLLTKVYYHVDKHGRICKSVARRKCTKAHPRHRNEEGVTGFTF